jgi:hypothetical protein
MPPTPVSLLARHLRAAERAALSILDATDPAELDLARIRTEVIRLRQALRRAEAVVERMQEVK